MTLGIDKGDMINVGMDRSAALRVREELRHLLRAWEDAHALPHSFETKAERELRIQVAQRGMPKQ